MTSARLQVLVQHEGDSGGGEEQEGHEVTGLGTATVSPPRGGISVTLSSVGVTHCWHWCHPQ